MGWPITGSPNYAGAYLAQGVTTIRWGTDGILSNQALGGSGSGGYGGFFIVESVRASDRLDIHEIKQGSGLVVARITLWQGRKYVATVLDDTTMIPPAPLTMASIADVLSGGLASVNARIIENGGNAERESEFKRNITFEALTCIELNNFVPTI